MLQLEHPSDPDIIRVLGPLILRPAVLQLYQQLLSAITALPTSPWLPVKNGSGKETAAHGALWPVWLLIFVE